MIVGRKDQHLVVSTHDHGDGAPQGWRVARPSSRRPRGGLLTEYSCLAEHRWWFLNLFLPPGVNVPSKRAYMGNVRGFANVVTVRTALARQNSPPTTRPLVLT